jgi:hypothetical protein
MALGGYDIRVNQRQQNLAFDAQQFRSAPAFARAL